MAAHPTCLNDVEVGSPTSMLSIPFKNYAGMPYVSSTAISRIEWFHGVLSVWFHSSGRYDHPGVPEELFLRFLSSPSKGAFYSTYIRGRY